MLLINAVSAPSPIHRFGLFARELVPCGTQVTTFRKGIDLALSDSELERLPAAARKQFLRHGFRDPGTGLLLLDADDARFTNHSDAPNTELRGDSSYALRDIHPGEEITLDHRTLGDENPPDQPAMRDAEVHPGETHGDWIINGVTGLHLGRTGTGWGLFASRAYNAGDHLLTFSGPILTLDQTLALGPWSMYPLQVGRDRYIDCSPPGAFINHSCNPNCAVRDTNRLVALGPLAAGEECTMDYSGTMTGDPDSGMVCRCGSANCRGKIENFEVLSPTQQATLLKRGLVSDFIARTPSEHTSGCVGAARTPGTLPGLPEFPEFAPLRLSQKETVDAFTGRHLPYVEFNFTSLIAFDNGESMLSRLGDNLVVRAMDIASGERYVSLLGTDHIPANLERLIAAEAHRPAGERAVLRAIPEELAAAASSLRWEEDPNAAEYIYSTEHWIGGNSSALERRRTRAKLFHKRHPHARFEPIDLHTVGSCARIEAAAAALLESLGLGHGLLSELQGLSRCLAHGVRFGLLGFQLVIADRIVGYILNEPLPNGWFHAHFGKAERSIPGANEYLLLENARAMGALGFLYHNDHEDMGLAGLRSFKRAMEPVRMLRKSRLHSEHAVSTPARAADLPHTPDRTNAGAHPPR